jgi:hypothetical protein
VEPSKVSGVEALEITSVRCRHLRFSRSLVCTISVISLSAWVVMSILVYGQEPTPSGFNFVLRYHVGGHVIDTAKGTFTRDTASPRHTITIELNLTQDEMEQIEMGLDQIDFWNDQKYPSIFSIPLKRVEGERVGVVFPSASIVLAVTRRGVVNTLTWNDNIIYPSYGAAEELRALINRIVGLIEAKPEYQKLPASKAVYF